VHTASLDVEVHERGRVSARVGGDIALVVGDCELPLRLTPVLVAEIGPTLAPAFPVLFSIQFVLLVPSEPVGVGAGVGAAGR
jgi:hypothetical protein